MTLGNRREPSFDGAHQSSHAGAREGFHIGAADQKAHAAVRATGLTRVVSSAQIIGSLLAVPLGLASGYSMYKANFAVDTTCQNLRAGIIAMLDKNVDPATRRMLVKRDITTFEQTCGGIDPDAHAAFKALVAEPAAATVAAPKLRAALPAAEAARKSEPKAETAKAEVKPAPKAEPKVEAKAEPKVEAKPEAKLEAKTEAKIESKSEPKQAVAAAPPVDAETAQRESDMRWLASVRQALVTHGPEKTEAAPEAAKVEVKPAQIETAAAAKPVALPAPLQPAWNVPAPVVAGTPAADVPARASSDHPVPPAPIPGTTLAPTPVNGETDNADDSGQSKIGSWIAQIPLVGRVIERGN